MKAFDLIRYRLIFYVISIILTVFGAFIPNFISPSLGIDLAGGSLVELKTTISNIDQAVKIYGRDYTVFPTQAGYLIKARQLNQEGLIQTLKQQDSNLTVLRHEEISPSFSGELKQKALLYIVLVLIAIGLYITIAFWRVQKQLSGWLLGLTVIICLFHDVVASFGVFVVLAKLFNYSLDLTIVTALLVVAGFSVHDTIVVFDRLRENVKKTNRIDRTIFNQSVQETFVRSVNTSLTTVLSVFPLVFLLPHLGGFLLTLILGIIIGTYSSIFLATPLLYDWSRHS